MTPEAKAAYLGPIVNQDPAQCAPIAAGSAAETPTHSAGATAVDVGALRTPSAAVLGDKYSRRPSA